MVRHCGWLAAVALAIISGSMLASAQTCRYEDEDGVPTITNVPPARPVRNLVCTGGPSNLSPQPVLSRDSSSVNSIIEKYARQYQLDPDLIRSMIKTESGFNPKAVSSKGAQGLMQLMPQTSVRLGVKNPFDPEENIRGGVQHLRTLLDTFDNNLTLSLAAYNAGENLVQRINRIPDYRETREYVQTVTKLFGKKDFISPAATRKPQEFYQFIDQDGVLNLTNIPPARLSEIKQFSLRNSQGTPE
jgi:soluble lytic murein transglycosylase